MPNLSLLLRCQYPSSKYSFIMSFVHKYKNPPLVLASASPSRRLLLAQLRLPFDVMPADIDETARENESPDELVARLSRQKAEKVVARLEQGLVIGSDQVAVQNGQIIGKPSDRNDAIAQLSTASGGETVLHTGMALISVSSGNIQQCIEHCHVRFRALSRAQIERYLDREKPYGSCGSLRVEGLGIALIESIQCNDPNAIIGLPLIKLIEFLANEGVEVI